MKSTTVEFLNEYANIRRGLHPGWEGDRVLNAESFIWRTARHQPKAAAEISADLLRDASAASELSGISPSRIKFIANELTKDPQ
jgi:hypothetical protein